MKNLVTLLLIQMLIGSSLFAQHQDEVVYTMYRYHPKDAIQKLRIDSCQIHEDDGDTMLLVRTIIYDTLGREVLSKEYKKGYDFIFTYNEEGLLMSSKIWDYEVGEGPTDSFTYNKDGTLKNSYNYWKVNNSKGTHYIYKDGNLVKSLSESFESVYSYKNGRRTGYISKYNGKVNSRMAYFYDSSNNLTKMYAVDKFGNKSLHFELTYDENNLLTVLSAFSKGVLSQQYNKTYNDKLIIKASSCTGITNGNVDDCDYTRTEYTYFYRK